jgi:nitrate reductase gamma subunit
MTTFLWVIVPYVCLAVFVVGHFWRYRYDKFGWTTRSSQLYEDRLLRIGSPLFHFGMLGVVMGHVIGLIIPQVWTNALGLSPAHVPRHRAGRWHPRGDRGPGRTGDPGLPPADDRPRVQRHDHQRQGHVRRARHRHPLGMWNTVAGSLLQFGGEYNYREGVSVWFRSIFAFQPQPELMAAAPLGFQLHALLAFILFAMWPFTRLVHVFSAPLGYLTRPYLVYRSKDERPGRGSGNRAPQRGWDKPELTRK